MAEDKYTITNREETEGSELVLDIEVPLSVIDSFKANAIHELGKEIEIDGFRKGNAPEKMIIEKVGEMAVLEKAAYRAVNDIVPAVMINEKVQALTMPGVNVTKLVPGEPVTFKMTITLMPKVELPDYKKIAKGVAEEKVADVEDKEVEEYINYLRQQRAQAESMQKGEQFDPEKTVLPVFDDEFVKTLGNFTSVDQFKEELLKNMKEEKKQKATETRRLKIIEAIIEEAKIDVPNVMVDEELEQMFGKFKHDIQRFRMQPEDYLKEIKKTEEDLKNEWRPDAVKRTKMNLILPQIAVEEKIKADEKEVEKEVAHLKQHHPDITDQQAKMYLERVMTNEAVFKFLEEQK